MLKPEHHAMLKQMAVNNALQWFDDLIADHERGVREIRRMRENFVEAVEGKASQFATPVNVLGWTVNACQNVQRNLRLDLVGNHAAALVAAEASKS